MSDLVDLLPDGEDAPPFERAAVKVVDARSRMTGKARRIVGVRHDEIIDPLLLPWLLKDWGLEDAAAFVDDWQRLYREGKTWQRARGTWEAFDIARAWAGFPDAIAEEIMPGGIRWAEYQIGLGVAPEVLDPIANIIGLARLSAGAKSVLTRIFEGFDVRAMRPDFGRLDESLLDADSGVRLRPDWPVLSLGRRYLEELDSSELRGATDVLASARTLFASRYVDDVMLDWADPAWTSARTVRDVFTTNVSNFENLDRPPENQIFIQRRIVKAGIIPDQQWPTGDVNFVFPAYRVEARGTPWLADGFRLDRDTERRERVEVIEIVVDRQRSEATIPASSPEMVSRTVQGFDFDVRAEAVVFGVAATAEGFESNYVGQNWLSLPWPDAETWDSYRNPVGFYGDPSQ